MTMRYFEFSELLNSIVCGYQLCKIPGLVGESQVLRWLFRGLFPSAF
jgi:hypothetical protein